MGAAQVDVALGDGGHTQLVEGPAEEGSEGAGEHHVAVPHGAAHRHAHLRERRERRRGESEECRMEQRTRTRIKRQLISHNVDIFFTEPKKRLI